MTTTRYNGVAVVSSTECTVGFKITIESLYNAPDISDFYIALFSNISEAQRDEHMQILQQTCASDDSLRFTRIYSTRVGDDRVINYHRDIITGGVAVARAGTRATIRATPKTVNITTIEVYPNRKCVIDTYKPRPP